MKADKANFDSMLTIAEMAEQWHHNRRQLEFKIMISYTTLLALALYQIIKPREVPVSFDVHWAIVLCLGLLLVFGIYWRWQYIFHIASNNDVRRRDFYLKKAELILHHMSQSGDSQFVPHSNKTVRINLAAEMSRGMSEVELFDKAEPDIYIHSKKIGTPPPKWYRNRYILLQLVGPAMLTISFIVVLFIKAGVIKADVIKNIVEISRSWL